MDPCMTTQSINHLGEQCSLLWIDSATFPVHPLAPTRNFAYESHSDFSGKPLSLVSASHRVTGCDLDQEVLLFGLPCPHLSTIKDEAQVFQTCQAMEPLQNQHARQRECSTHLSLSPHSLFFLRADSPGWSLMDMRIELHFFSPRK